MERTNQLRTLGALIMFILLACVNTVVSFAVDMYSEPLGWMTFVVAAIVVVIGLRYQQRLTTAATTALFALPFVVVLLGVVLAL